jgi:hypothetical protein
VSVHGEPRAREVCANAKCFHEIAGDRGVKLVVGAAHSVEQEARRWNESSGFFEIVAARIAVEISCARIGLGLQAMVDSDRGRLTEPGKDRLRASTKAGEVMGANASGCDDQIMIEQGAMNTHRRPARRDTELDKIVIAVTVVVDDRRTIESFVGETELGELTWTMRARRDRDRETRMTKTTPNRGDEGISRLAA